jgi:demethylmenaquinone methyltransferase/2-methoxy-6-polyprenyl-1,4-benzoquinol methylase
LEPADANVVEYYRRRAGEYEAIYARPERQAELARLRQLIPDRLRGRRVLEVACGTGYWTVPIARAAAEVLATDISEEPLRIARAKPLPEGRVQFRLADAFAFGASLGSFDAAFAGFWWSHVARARIGEFLASLHARLLPGASVLLLDNRYVEGSSTPLCERDADGNTYQLRRLAGGSETRLLKNFPSEAELRGSLSPHAAAFSYQALEHYWLVEYRLQ